ncbi:uncharacterized protein J3R85_010677 [Psidium guajava]|nr:uncharacterized protein J3R85_010677 [Psidium guajava]
MALIAQDPSTDSLTTVIIENPRKTLGDPDIASPGVFLDQMIDRLGHEDLGPCHLPSMPVHICF